MKGQVMIEIRPLPRSLDPLPGESLPGFVLRLAHRLSLTPARLCALTGLAMSTSVPGVVSQELLLRVSPQQRDAFAMAARLDPAEVDQLCLGSLTSRYPLPRSTWDPHRSVSRLHHHRWVFTPQTRYCPTCLAAEQSMIQRDHGGAWQKLWHLPVVFACLDHQQLLQHQCPACQQRPHGNRPGRSIRLLPRMRDGTLHPAQCRAEIGPPRKGKTLAGCCGASLDAALTSNENLTDLMLLDLQRRIIDLLRPDGPQTTLSAGLPTRAASYFTDLRLLTALLSSTWPAARDLAPAFAPAIDRHINDLRHKIATMAETSPSSRTLLTYDTPPADAKAGAALLLIADRILSQDNPHSVREYLQPLLPPTTTKASRSTWGAFAHRQQSDCSKGFLEAFQPLLRSFTRVGGRSQARRAATIHPVRLGPQHIPAFLPQPLYEKHFRHIDVNPKLVRRTITVRLVQLITGGSLGAAAEYLGINLTAKQYQGAERVHRWIVEHTSRRQFDAAVHTLIEELDTTTYLANYHHRRHLLQNWSLDPETWRGIVSQLPPTPGPIQPDLGDLKRQCASVVVWARATQGEHLFAPRPIEFAQTPDVQRRWQTRRNTLWHQFQTHRPLRHYANLRRLLNEHSDQLTNHIDSRPYEPDQPARGSGFAGGYRG